MAYETLIYQPGPVARVILNRPERLNAQSHKLLYEMDAAFAEADADAQARIVVLSGAGRSFSSGHDIDSAESVAERRERERDDADRWALGERYKQLYVDMHMRWRNLPKPTLAMVHGYCFFGGWMIAAAMDIIYASEDALFVPTYGDYMTTSWDVGPRKAKELLFGNRIITAREAMEWGFVNRVFPADELETETMIYAARVAENDSASLRTIKHTINQAQDMQGFTTSVWSLSPSLWGRQWAYPEVRQASELQPPPRPPGGPFRSRVQRAMQYLKEDAARQDERSGQDEAR
jgi:enoyl-CoA hydratase/carnithine racemase